MVKKFKSKIAAMIVVMLAVIMFINIPVSAYEFNGESGGGTGNSSTVSGTYGLADTNMNAVGYRFSYVDYNGNALKPSINLLASSYSQYKKGVPQASTTQWGYPYYNKIQIIRNPNAAINTVGFTSANGNAAASDFNVFGTGDMPYEVSKIRAYFTTDTLGGTHMNSLCQYFGLSSASDLQNGDKILIEPIFMMKMDGKQYCLTISELGLWGCAKWGANLPNSTGGGANAYGWIASYTNRAFPSALYSTDSKFWTPAYNAGTGGDSNSAVSYDENGNIGYGAANPESNKGLILFKCLISYGYGVGFVYNNTTPPETTKPVDLYCWGVEWYSDAGYKNFVAESTLNANNAGERLVEGRTYYPVYVFKNNSNTTVQANANVYKDEPCLLFKNS